MVSLFLYCYCDEEKKGKFDTVVVISRFPLERGAYRYTTRSVITRYFLIGECSSGISVGIDKPVQCMHMYVHLAELSKYVYFALLPQWIYI